MIVLFLVLLGAGLISPILGPRGRWGPLVLSGGPAFAFIWVWGQGWLWSAPEEFRWPWVPQLGVEFALRRDGLSTLFLLLIFGVGTWIVLYGGQYLKGHRDLGRFYILLFVFMASMAGIVLADDALLLFIFWEGTSLSSYLLIGFHHEEASARRAARKALIVTGAGGLALLGGFVLLHHMTGSWRVSEWLAMKEYIYAHPLSVWALGCVLLGACTKSAQWPFHFWLPAAMAGPTPVSAYLHSATMVKAGIFLLARFSPVWAQSAIWFGVLIGTGGVTMLLSAWCALRERDLKAILAMTTLMALGLIVMLLGFGDKYSIQAAVSYLLIHAFYKGALFMVAGAVDHGAHTRNLDELSGLRSNMPRTALAATLASASMAGLPFFFGFVGKESVYEAHLHAESIGLFVLMVSVASNVALFVVSGVFVFRTFWGTPSSAAQHAHEGTFELWLGPVVLGGLGCVFGVAPFLLDELVSEASSAIGGKTIHAHLALWHGAGPALWASLLTYGLGIAVFVGGRELHRSQGLRWMRAFFLELPSFVFERAYLSWAEVCCFVTKRFYSGQLRRYVQLVLGLWSTSILAALVANQYLQFPTEFSIYPHEAGLLIILVITSWVGAVSWSPIRSIIAVGISGYCVALIYLLFGAPDVAMTQFAIETLTVILVVLTLLHLPQMGTRAVDKDSGLSLGSVLDAGFAILSASAITVLLLGVISGELPLDVSGAYLQRSVPDAHGHNVVNVILVDFRGFDTWGEITVLTISGLGVYALLRKKARWGGLGMPPAPPTAQKED